MKATLITIGLACVSLIATIIIAAIILSGQISGLKAEMKADVREIQRNVTDVSNGVADNRTRLALVAFATKHGIAHKLPPHIVSGTAKPMVSGQKAKKPTVIGQAKKPKVE